MKKKLNFIISFILVLAISVGAFIIPASSFKNDEITSSASMLLINLETKTHVYSLKADKPHYLSYQSELMTFLLMTDAVDDPQEVTVTVDEDFIKKLDYSDGCLDLYRGDKLTLKDLGAIMMLSSGSDAAYLIADYVSGGDVDSFVKQMNERAAKYKCKRTHFVSPGYSDSKDHYSTCADLCRIYSRLIDNKLYKEIMESPTYIPEKYGDDEDYAVTTENSIMNPRSPYYFRYVTGGKCSYDPLSGASIVVTTCYQDMNYLFVAMKGKNKAEENVFADARRMTTWAYLNLSDRKVIDTTAAVTTSTASASWGEYDVDLYADNSARKTLPNDYDSLKFEINLDVPEKLKLPIFRGESVGDADVYYDGERIDKVGIVPGHDEGVSMLYDLGRYSGDVLDKLFPDNPAKDAAKDKSGDLDLKITEKKKDQKKSDSTIAKDKDQAIQGIKKSSSSKR